jgi:hypothetical protein
MPTSRRLRSLSLGLADRDFPMSHLYRVLRSSQLQISPRAIHANQFSKISPALFIQRVSTVRKRNRR